MWIIGSLVLHHECLLACSEAVEMPSPVDVIYSHGAVGHLE